MIAPHLIAGVLWVSRPLAAVDVSLENIDDGPGSRGDDSLLFPFSRSEGWSHLACVYGRL